MPPGPFIPAKEKVTGTQHKALLAVIAISIGCAISESAGTIKKKEQEDMFLHRFKGDGRTMSELKMMSDGVDRYTHLWDDEDRVDKMQFHIIDGLSKKAVIECVKLSSTGEKAKEISGKQLKAKSEGCVLVLKKVEAIYNEYKKDGKFPSGKTEVDALRFAAVEYFKRSGGAVPAEEGDADDVDDVDEGVMIGGSGGQGRRSSISATGSRDGDGWEEDEDEEEGEEDEDEGRVGEVESNNEIMRGWQDAEGVDMGQGIADELGIGDIPTKFLWWLPAFIMWGQYAVDRFALEPCTLVSADAAAMDAMTKKNKGEPSPIRDNRRGVHLADLNRAKELKIDTRAVKVAERKQDLAEYTAEYNMLKDQLDSLEKKFEASTNAMLRAAYEKRIVQILNDMEEMGKEFKKKRMGRDGNKENENDEDEEDV